MIQPIGKMTLEGIEIDVIRTEDAEAADLVVCGETPCFPDDVHTLCAWCRRPIVHRPYMPQAPPKVCLSCVLLMNQAQEVN